MWGVRKNSRDYKEEKQIIDKILDDITAIRNLKATNNITKKALVLINIENEYLGIYKSQLKINDENCVTEPQKNFLANNYKSKYIDITYYYEGSTEDKTKIEEEIKKLEQSIQRRKQLLANENYVNKAPVNIVKMDKDKLKEEEEKLALLKTK